MPIQTGEEAQLAAEWKAFLLAEEMYQSQFHYFKAKELKTNNSNKNRNNNSR